MKYLIFILLLLIGCNNIPSNVELFKKAPEASLLPLAATAELNDFTRLVIDENILSSIKSSNTIDFTLPYKDKLFYIHLDKINIFADDFNVRSNSNWEPAQFSKGLYYSGYVKGIDSSIVTLTITNINIVSGIISIPGMEDLTLTRAIEKNTNQYIILNSFQESKPITFNCQTAEATQEYKQTAKNTNALNSSCVTIDFEIDYSTYQHFGSVSAASSWITSLFAPVAILYQNEGINITIKSIFVWTSPDNYNSNAAVALTELSDKRKNDPNFTATFVQLIRGKSGGALQGIAYVGTMCVNNYRFSYAEPLYNFAAFPAYSWSVNVLTHELGHNMGSPHTQSCTWPGGAIDNCYQTEGGCTPGPAPTNGGSIMSYCHLTSYGIKFSNGFGPLPGAKIREYYNSANCISCAVVPPPVVPPVPPVPPVVDENLILRKPASQSSILSSSYLAMNANDGNLNSFSHTNREVYPWIQFDLLTTTSIDSIEIINRLDCCGYRLREFKTFVSDSPIIDFNNANYKTYFFKNSGLGNGGIFRAGNLKASGRYFTLVAKNFQAGDYLSLAEIKAFGGGVSAICKDTIYKVPSVRDSAGKVCR